MKNEGSSPPKRLLIADDHALVREGMRAMLASEQNLEVVGEAESGREALELCRELRPDLILMDVRMPEMDGLAATREIKGEYPETRILILTTHESPEYLMDAIRAGAAGYVLKDSTKQRLLDAVRRVISGESPVNQELAMQVIQRLTDENRRHAEPLPEPAEKLREEALADPLTDREIEVLRLLALGKTNRQVAKELLISLSTVKTHIQHVNIKLGVSDRTQAAVRAIELGLLSKEE
ncbi:MAG: response regulator transcription factor [Rubrobacter sp.]|nr:response regulator transcription factor [Rubrobacter sp.]